jgi:hypothetical protein
LAYGHFAAGENLAVTAQHGSFAYLDVSVFAQKNGISSQEYAVADEYTFVIETFCVEKAVVVYGNIAAYVYFVRMPQNHVGAEYNVSTHASQKQRVKFFAQNQSKSPWHPGCSCDDELVAHQGQEVGFADNQLEVFAQGGATLLEQRFLYFYLCAHAGFSQTQKTRGNNRANISKAI